MSLESNFESKNAISYKVESSIISKETKYSQTGGCLDLFLKIFYEYNLYFIEYVLCFLSDLKNWQGFGWTQASYTA